MKLSAVIALGAGLAIATVACEVRQVNSGEEEPLLLEDSPVLGAAGLGADNSRCHVCHANYVLEELAVVHAQAGMSCVKCHGDCDAHIADESWAWGGGGTPPEVMFPRGRVNPFCMECHPGGDLDTEHHEDLLAGVAGNQNCTDCHGEHRLARRKQDWRSARAVVGIPEEQTAE